MRYFAAVMLPMYAGALFAQAGGPAGRIDQGVFEVVVSGSAPHAESFRIFRSDDDAITATASVLLGGQQINSSLTTDTLGTPLRYTVHVSSKTTRLVDLTATARSGRLSSLSSNQRGDESMREYALSGQAIILDTGLLHQLYFVTLAHRTGRFQIIEPRLARSGIAELTARGLEPVVIGGRSATATHYSLAMSNGSLRYEFWVDAAGRVLKVDVPAEGLVATRDELP